MFLQTPKPNRKKKKTVNYEFVTTNSTLDTFGDT